MNRDGILDHLKFQLDMPMADSEEVLGVTLILIFDYKLRVSNTVCNYDTVCIFIEILLCEFWEKWENIYLKNFIMLLVHHWVAECSYMQ